MATLDNPAGRLHALLSRFWEEASEQEYIYVTWARVLAVDDSTSGATHQAIAEAAGLVSQIELAVQRTGKPAQAQVVQQYRGAWLAPMFPPGGGRTTPSKVKNVKNAGAMASLALLSEFLSDMAPEGVVPDEDTLARVRESLEEAMAAVLSDVDLSTDVRGLLLDHLHRLRWAVDHITVGGPDAVIGAAERLAGVMATMPEDQVRGGVVDVVRQNVGWIWKAFVFGPTMHKQIEGWSEIIKAIGPGA